MIPRQSHPQPVFLPCDAAHMKLNLRLADTEHLLKTLHHSAQIANVTFFIQCYYSTLTPWEFTIVALAPAGFVAAAVLEISG